MKKDITKNLLHIGQKRANSIENKKKILVVDDKEAMRDMFKWLLESTKLFSVQTAENGKEAINIIKQQTFNLLITDYEMPMMNGYELFKECKAIRPEIPVIFVTGNKLNEKAIESAKKEGLAYLIYKPFDTKELINIVKVYSST